MKKRRPSREKITIRRCIFCGEIVAHPYLSRPNADVEYSDTTQYNYRIVRTFCHPSCWYKSKKFDWEEFLTMQKMKQCKT